ncbi:type III restriction protein res subunit [Rhodopirellula maiorica SM1]|uniref:Type III restriction protein res subunit n=1 Tax=Rhodopirellula maiorica SM1 TaxID=1265738 RepID=M5RS15_9BACT|nr:DEAD/DEAH box helicase family protein [Rhodopirellula maiorica]EMI22085.1 type III restriction protein res subunit [Rhodopirellula maiorica SM1]
MKSPFLCVPPEDWIASNELAFAIFDGFPVAPGHSLVVTKRLVATWFDATPAEQAALMELVNVVKQKLDETLRPKPDGYNVGFNAGSAAGQTVDHVHVHVIPRYRGDVADPRGGVRHVIPEKANYLIESAGNSQVDPGKTDSFLSVGHPQSPLWEHLAWRIAGAKSVDVLVSFVQSSGLEVIEERLFEAIANGASVRIVVSDYLFISDPKALRTLLGWCELSAEESSSPRLSVKLIEMAKLPSNPASFHPKAWRIVEEYRDFISVGSSNLSKPALLTGVEWNLLSTTNTQESSHAQFTEQFDLLWDVASTLTPDLVGDYAKSAEEYRREHFVPVTPETLELPSPRAWQVEALQALQRVRDAGHRRALVAVATGMGKTWLAAFDACQFGESNRRRPRVLVIAHRAHILAQTEAVLSRLLDHRFAEGSTAWYIGERSELAGDLVVASVQKLSRPEGLQRLAKEHFDYVIMDEVHHASAPSYRRVLAKLDCDFALGLTATPERTDGVDVATIFDDNLAFHASIGDGIAEDSLVPFHYVGIKDTVDFRQIPWRNGRFDVAELEQRVARSERMDKLWVSMQEHPAERTIVFCCSKRHALFARDWLIAKGVSSAAVFSGEGSDSCGESLERLRSGELQTLCVVDMFNEGLDIPAVDRVVMLRPTESKIIFLQQLGRGLRASEGKSRLLVIDFVGNHRIFAQRIVHLLSLRSGGDKWKPLKDWLGGKEVDLPEGCLLDVELDAKDMLKKFLPKGKSAAIEGYRAIRDELGRRPTPMEVYGQGYLPRTICAGEGSWFEFVKAEGDLNEAEEEVVALYADWLKTVETTNLNKSYKMVVLRVLLDSDQLFSGVGSFEFAKKCRRFMQSHEVLKRDLRGSNHAVDHESATDEEWAKWWGDWPIDRWLDKQNGTVWFAMKEDLFQSTIDCPDHLKPTLESLSEELVDWRLAAYTRSRRLVASEGQDLSFEGKVSHTRGRPILFLPEKSKMPRRPMGPTSVLLPNGEVWEFKFVKVACNVAAPAGEKKNQLGDLLQKWFGPKAGLPGTNFHVQFTNQNGQWHVAPCQFDGAIQSDPVEPIELEADFVVPEVPKAAKYKTHAPVYDLTVAAGEWGPEGVPAAIGWIEVPSGRLAEGMFAARVTGHSMEPTIPTGAWCLFRPIDAGSREGKLLLVQVNTHTDPEEGGRYTIKRYHSTKHVSDDGWEHIAIELQPLNKDYAPIQVSADQADDLRVIGEFVSLIAPSTSG